VTGREKIEAAFSASGTREIPAVICYEGIYYRDRWDEVTGCPWWYVFSPDIDEQYEWRANAIERIGQDWFVLPYCRTREGRRGVSIVTRGEDAFEVDASTGREEKLTRPVVAGWSPAGDLASVHPEKLAQTPGEIEDAIGIPADWNPDRVTSEGRDDLAKMMLRGCGRDLYPIQHVSSPFWRLYSLWGFEGMMMMVASRPDLVKCAVDRALVLAIRQVKEAAVLGAYGIWIEECLTDMVSPRAFAEFNLPALKKLVEEIRRAGMRSIYYYCGNPNDRWDLLFSAGADALSLEESKKGWTVDIDEVVKRAGGRCAVLGNLDAIHLLPKASEKELSAEIARQIAAGRRNSNRFIMSIGSPVTPGTPVSRVRRYCDLVRELCR